MTANYHETTVLGPSIPSTRKWKVTWQTLGSWEFMQMRTSHNLEHTIVTINNQPKLHYSTGMSQELSPLS